MNSAFKKKRAIKAYVSDSQYQEDIENIFRFLEDNVSSISEGSFYTDHALAVAELISSWGLNISLIKASLLHDIKIRNIVSIENISALAGEQTLTVLEEYAYINTQIKSLEASNISPELVPSTFDIRGEALYITIAERINMLSHYIATDDPKGADLARKTHNILIPVLKTLKAYKLVDTLEELCLQIENQHAYSEISSAIAEEKSLCDYYMHQFMNRMDQIFNPDSNIIPISLKGMQGCIKSFDHNTRSIVSLYRYLANVKSADTSWKTAIDRIKNTSKTAYYDLTLVIKDDCLKEGITAIDIFMAYFKNILRLKAEAVSFHGYFETTYKDAHYFIISDAMKNMYRFFIRSESSFFHYKYGDFADDSIKASILDSQNNQIKVFLKNGRAMFLPEGSCVLDAAFMIHEDLGLYFAQAKLNKNGIAMPAYTVLHNGDTVEIIKNKQMVTADLTWFRYVKTSKAINDLIKYFKMRNTASASTIQIITKDGSTASIPAGSTVLDYAFMINEETGLHFAYATINGAKKHYEMNYVLKHGDRVIINTSDGIRPDFHWFRYAKTARACDYLISYFKNKSSSR